MVQAESEAISENVKWAIRKAFQKGIGNTKRRTFGYHWVEGTMTVIQEEAEIVERISRDFLAGESQTKIAGKLTREGVTSVNGNPISVSAVEIFCGTLLTQGILFFRRLLSGIQFPERK